MYFRPLALVIITVGAGSVSTKAESPLLEEYSRKFNESIEKSLDEREVLQNEFRKRLDEAWEPLSDCDAHRWLLVDPNLTAQAAVKLTDRNDRSALKEWRAKVPDDLPTFACAIEAQGHRVTHFAALDPPLLYTFSYRLETSDGSIYALFTDPSFPTVYFRTLKGGFPDEEAGGLHLFPLIIDLQTGHEYFISDFVMQEFGPGRDAYYFHLFALVEGLVQGSELAIDELLVEYKHSSNNG